jgi:hypothetical protein
MGATYHRWTLAEVKRESRRLRGETSWFSRGQMRGRVDEKYAQPASGPGGVYLARLPTALAPNVGRVLRFHPSDGAVSIAWWDDCDKPTEDELRATAKILAARPEAWWYPRPPTARELLGDAVLDELVAATEKRLLARMRAMEIPVALSPEDDDGREAIERAAAEAIGGLRSSSKSSLRALWSGCSDPARDLRAQVLNAVGAWLVEGHHVEALRRLGSRAFRVRDGVRDGARDGVRENPWRAARVVRGRPPRARPSARPSVARRRR